jgi:hypothetical protein
MQDSPDASASTRLTSKQFLFCDVPGCAHSVNCADDAPKRRRSPPIGNRLATQSIERADNALIFLKSAIPLGENV